MIINGSDLMVFMEYGGKTVSVALSTSHTLNLTMNTVDVSTKDNGNGRWQSSEAGLRSWEVTTDNLVGDGSDPGVGVDALILKMMTGEKVKLVFGLQGNMDTEGKDDDPFKVPEGGWTPLGGSHYKGEALVTSISVNANNGEKASYNATFTGCGGLNIVGNGIGKSATPVSLQSTEGTQVPVSGKTTTTTSSK